MILNEEKAAMSMCCMWPDKMMTAARTAPKRKRC